VICGWQGFAAQSEQAHASCLAVLAAAAPDWQG